MIEPRCTHCEQTIGVYEPLVVLADGRPRETSRAAEPHAVHPGVRCYHRSCFERIEDHASEM
ncbi:MAG: hypothetical protein H0X28_13680 [Solirubrobacterales bacterium]|nr:hypothetical protein [Solirubrobacterales bacterium]